MRWPSWLLCGLLLALPSSYALAGDPPPVQPIRAGEVSPVDGVVVPAERFRELLEQAKDYRVLIEVYELEVTSLRAQIKTIAASAIMEEKLRHEADVSKLNLDIAEYRKRLEKAENPPFYKANEFHRLIGLILGIAVGIAAGGL
jgi:hypothetical protein